MKTVTEKLRDEVSEFERSIEVTPKGERSAKVRTLSDESDSYLYNQLQRLYHIDRYYNSEFESGKLDGEGQRKTFLNIVRFAADVAAKQTDIDVKDYLFIPDTTADVDATWLMRRQFQVWTREHDYGHILNEINNDYSKYGTAVIKRVGKSMERVDLKTLRVTQNAKTMRDAVRSGGFVHQVHELTPYEMRQFRDWKVDKLSDVDEDEQVTVEERHGLMRKGDIDDTEDKTVVLGVAFVVRGRDNTGDIILFSEQEDDLPFEEVHWTKQDGRWLGIGEVENQLENQVARNLTANLRRRNLLWGAKKIFQSSDTDMVGKNLVKEVADGEVVEVGPDGAINQVNTQSQHQGDYNADDVVWQENSRQKSFMFEVNTGESMPSGTPFRLGVILSNASQTHFNLKRENLGFFLKRSFFNHLIPVFQKQMRNKEHNIAVAANEEGIERYREAVFNVNTNQRLKEKILDKNLTRNLLSLSFDFEKEKEKIKQELEDEPYLFLKVPEHYFDNVKYRMELTLTGEEIDVEKRIETLSTLYQALPPEDERRDRVLNRIISLTGMDSESLLKQSSQNAKMKQIMEQMQGQGGGLQGLTKQGNAGTTNPKSTPSIPGAGAGAQR